MQYLNMFLNLYMLEMGLLPPIEENQGYVVILEFFIFCQVTIDVTSPEAGVIQKVIYWLACILLFCLLPWQVHGFYFLCTLGKDKILNVNVGYYIKINCWQFVAKEGDTVEPGTKIAIISKSAEGVAPVAPSEKASEKAVLQPSPPSEKSEEKQKPKVETAPVTAKPKAPSTPPPKRSATEPQLPPKERERRVSLFLFY